MHNKLFGCINHKINYSCPTEEQKSNLWQTMRQNDERVKYVVMILHAENLIMFYSDVTKELTV